MTAERGRGSEDEAIPPIASSQVRAADVDLGRSRSNRGHGAVARGEALWACGDWDGAAEAFQLAVEAAAPSRIPAAAAWQFGALLYLRDDTARAEMVLRGADLHTADDAEAALVCAWLAAAVWRRGDVDDAERLSGRAEQLSARSGDSRAVAAAQVARALVCAARGDRQANAQAYRAALRAASDAGDMIQIARIHSNLASRALEEADYEAALTAAARAVVAAAGHQFMLGLALANKAEALLRLGHLDLAQAAGQEAADAVEPAGAVNAAPAYLLLGEVYRQRGDRVQARWCFERGLRAGAASGDVHVLTAGHVAMAWILGGDDTAEAVRHAECALVEATTLERAAALNALAWALLCSEDREAAADAAKDAQSQARATDDRFALATALELAAAAPAPSPDIDTLRAAAAVWSAIGDRVSSARVELALAHASRDDRGQALAQRRLADLGASVDVGVPGYLVAASHARSRGTPSITTLGRFRVTVAGRTVTSRDWQSRKTRDLLKLLVAHTGLPVSRDAIMEWLWPGEATEAVGPRLSVTLSRLRTVLDPSRTRPSDFYVTANRASITLQIDELDIDVQKFLASAAEGARLAADGQWDDARARLRAAEELYVGDFLDDDRFEDWALSCRERVRTASMTCTRLLARDAAMHGAGEDAARWLSRLLQRDPYDEDAWTALIATQQRLRRHGEARHQHDLYARRMRELNLEPAALDSLAERLP